MEDLQKSWLETGIDNDFVFYYVMRNNLDLCCELLQAIFPDLGITRVAPVETQKQLEEAPDVHGVRLDVYTEDTNGRAYNVEMQVRNRGNIQKRSRFNQSMMDMYQLAKSMDYSLLKQSFVIFICDFDLFGRKRYVYTFENTCNEDSSLKLNDGISKVFVNARGENGTISDKLKSFLELIINRKATDDFTRKIQEAIDFAHLNQEARHAYMTVGMKIAEEVREAREEARKETWEEACSDINNLNAWLIENNRNDDLFRSITDRKFQEELLNEYKKSGEQAE